MIRLMLIMAFATAIMAAPSDQPRDQGESLCRFILHHYTVSPQTEAEVNLVVAKAIRQHEELFGFQLPRDFHVTIRIFGRYDDYERFAETNHHSVGMASARVSTNLAGYYSRATKEVVTWKPPHPDLLGNYLLHECSHAIMNAHFHRIPIWLSEGCAEYFASPHYMQHADDVNSLKYRWARLSLWLREKELPPLGEFLDLDEVEWHKLNTERAYTVSWSVFQLLMSTPQNRQLTRELMQELQGSWRMKMDCTGFLDQHYPGGTKRLEQNWHAWIQQAAPRVLGPHMEQILKAVADDSAANGKGASHQ